MVYMAANRLALAANRLSLCSICRLANGQEALVFKLVMSQWPLLGVKETEIFMSALENSTGLAHLL